MSEIFPETKRSWARLRKVMATDVPVPLWKYLAMAACCSAMIAYGVLRLYDKLAN